MKRYISAILSAAATASAASAFSPAAFAAEGGTVSVTYNYDGTDHTRQMEALDRGLVAVDTGNGVFLSWRLLGNESSVENIVSAPDFVVYKNGEELETVTDSTNYIDASGNASDTYSVALEGGEPCAAVSVQSENYFDIQLDKPDDVTLEDENTYSYSVGDTSCGDLDGDGDYELIVKWDCNAQDNSNGGYTGNVLLDAYDMETGFLWRIDLGRNIRGGAHYTQFLVYDFDQDGQAELCCKTAPGSMDSEGNYVNSVSLEEAVRAGDNSAVYVNAGGRIAEGDEYYTYFESDGTAADTVFYPYSRTSNDGYWGRDSGGNIDNWNRVDRFLGAVAYIDGEHPAAVTVRGYYDRTTVAAYNIVDGRLTLAASHDTYDYGGEYGVYGGAYAGQGNHNITVADVDDDGKDELLTGSICFDDDLSVKWSSGRGHGDALHIGDYDPTSPGLEYFSVHEGGGYTITESTTSSQGSRADYGMTVYSAATGEELAHFGASRDTGRGLMANTGMGGYYQVSSLAGDYIADGTGSFSDASSGIGQNFRIFWDGDLYDESLDGTSVSSWNGMWMQQIFNADGCTSINGTKNNPALQADLFGDWREELVYPTYDNSALRVYTTTDVTEYKLPTLMHDPVYRSGVAAEQTAYNQPPHIGFYLAEDTFKPDVESIEITNQPDKLEYKVGETFDSTGMVVTAHYVDGTDEIVNGYTVSGFDPNADGEQTVTVTFGGKTAELVVTVDSGFTADESGLITGYEGGDTEAVLPASIDGIPVTGFADGALADSGLEKITIEIDGITIGENVFPDGIVISCILGSDIYNYAVANGIETETIDTRQYSFDIKYDETEYENFVMLQTESDQSRSIGHITYGVGGRRRGGGDGNTGWETTQTADGEAVMNARVGRFASGTRYPYMNLNDLPELSDNTDSVFETDIMFRDYNVNASGNGEEFHARMVVSDSEGEVDVISTSILGIEDDTWYNYKLIYHKGTYYRVISDAEGVLIRKTELGSSSASGPANNISFRQESGNYSDDSQYASVLLDNTKAYTNTEITDSIINVTDAAGSAVPGALVDIGGESFVTGADGKITATLLAGLYDVNVSAEGYNDASTVLSAFRAQNELTITLSERSVELSGIELNRAELRLRPGDNEKLVVRALPDGEDAGSVVFVTDNEEVASVSADGTVTAVGSGTANITAYVESRPDIYAVCRVEVVSGTDTTPASIVVSGPVTAYIPNNGGKTAVEFTAEVYDADGVIIRDADVVWSNSAVLEMEGNVLLIDGTAEPGTVTVTAGLDGITGSAEVELEYLITADTMIAEETFEEDDKFLIDQTTDTTEYDTGDILYRVLGSRSSGNDTGFEIPEDGREVLVVKAGRWANSNRQARMEFAEAPDRYTEGTTYVIESRLAISGDMYITFCDADGNEIFSTTAPELGMEEGQIYNYRLTYRDGVYTQTVCDDDGNIISASEPVTGNDGAINMIDFIKGDTVDKSVGELYTFSYYTTDDVMSGYLTVNVSDGSGAPVADAEVRTGIYSAVTDVNGKAIFELPRGVYNINVMNGEYIIGTAAAVLDGNTSECDITCLSAPESIVLDGGSAELYTGDTFVINARVIPEDTFEDGVVFASSASDIADVSADGTITAKAPGSAVITVTSVYDSNIKAEFSVTVNELPESILSGVDGTVITADIYDNSLDMYAARYEDGVLVQLKLIDVSRETHTYDAGFEPDKVFLWNGMTPVDIWTAE